MSDRIRDLLTLAASRSWAVGLHYHVDASEGGGWCVEINDWSHFGTLDECLTAASERIGVSGVERLRRVLVVEQGDDSAGNPPDGWNHEVDLTDDAGAIIRHVWTGPGGWVHGSPYEGWHISRARPCGVTRGPTYDTALEAMEAADRAAEVSDV